MSRKTPTPPRNGTVRADARRNRETVLESAAMLLADRPDASMRDIAEASGVGRTTVYRHFPTRDDLLEGLFAYAVEEGNARSASMLAGNPPLREVFERIGREVVGSSEQFRFLQSHRALRSKAIRATAEHPNRPFTDYLALAVERGELRDDVELTWVISVIFASALSMADQVRGGLVSTDDSVGLLADTLMRAFAA